MTVYEIIMSNPMQTVRSGICKDKKSGEQFRFCQNQLEINRGMAIMFPLQEEILFEVSDADCIITGMPYGSKFIKPLSDGLFDMNCYDIISIDQ